MRNPPALAPAVLTAFLALAPATAQEQAPLDARSFAQRVEVEASPVHAFRYNQPIPAPNQTKALLTRRRAFYPGERVSLSFRLPPGASRRLVLVYGGGSPAALKRFLPQGRSAPKFSLFADCLVIGEDDKVVLEGYFRDGYRIPAR